MGHGGKRQGAGRKPKAEEQELIEKLSPLDKKGFKALEDGLDDGQSWAVKLFMEYRFGKPKQVTDITTNGENITIPQIVFTKSGENKN